MRGYLRTPGGPQIKVLVRGAPAERKVKSARLVTGVDEETRDAFAARVELIWGDVAQPHLGLDDSAYRVLSESVTDIIHSAASIDFAMSLSAARAVNYQGTVNLVDFARSCVAPCAFAYISTAHVAGKRTGRIAEDELDHAAGFVNAYEQSKYETEQFLRTRMGELPVAVYRSTTLIGDSRSGVVRQFNFFHNAMRFAYHGLVPALPGDPRGHVDLIPVDYAARAIQHLVDHNFRPGTTYHVCAEPRLSFCLEELVDKTFAALVASPFSIRRRLHKFPILEPAAFNRLVQDARDEGHARLLQALVPLTYFMPHLALPKVFDSGNTRRDLQGSGLTLPDIRTYYDRIVDYCLQTDWGRRPESRDNHSAD
ncbi:MAG: SDR family oxidoreductase [Chloroflexi bacterium]|nr:SDR family oxidoreductase [Chloroflexota bacterium]